jgi:hypothetical protein
VAVAAVGLCLQKRGGEAFVAPLLGAGPVGELGQRPGVEFWIVINLDSHDGFLATRRADAVLAFPSPADAPSRMAASNALAESFLDSFKTELIAGRVWRTRSQLELAIVEYVGWFNHTRLHQSLCDLPPAEYEALRPPRPETITSTDRLTETT